MNNDTRFKFSVGDIVKEIHGDDEQLIVGRAVDIDEQDTPIYITNKKNGGADWNVAEFLDKYYEKI